MLDDGSTAIQSKNGNTLRRLQMQSVNADLEKPFIKFGSDNNKWGGFDVKTSDSEYLRFQVNSSGRIELARYTNNSLNGVKVISDTGWS